MYKKFKCLTFCTIILYYCTINYNSTVNKLDKLQSIDEYLPYG